VPAAKKTTEKPQEQPDSEPLLTAQDFTRDASHAVGVAGMLADDPTLADAKLTLAEWNERFAQYMTSERP
jgi:hypothetical protein